MEETLSFIEEFYFNLDHLALHGAAHLLHCPAFRDSVLSVEEEGMLLCNMCIESCCAHPSRLLLEWTAQISSYTHDNKWFGCKDAEVKSGPSI